MNIQAARTRLEKSLVVRVLKRYMGGNGPTWATAVAWNILFCFFPMALVMTAFAGLILGGDTGHIDKTMSSILPGDNSALITEALHSAGKSVGILAVVSFLGLIWSGSALFGSIDQALDALVPCKPRGFVSQKLMATGMVLIFAVLVVAAVMSSSLVPLTGRIPGMPGFMTSGPMALLMQATLGTVDGIALFTVIYYVTPNRHIGLRGALPGGIAAGIAFEALTLLFPLYFRVQHGFSTYGATFGLFFLALTYAYFVAQVIVIGGAVNAELVPGKPGVRPDKPLESEASTEADLSGHTQEHVMPAETGRAD